MSTEQRGVETDSFAIAGEPSYKPGRSAVRMMGVEVRRPRAARLEVEAVSSHRDIVRLVAHGDSAAALQDLRLHAVVVARGCREAAPDEAICDRQLFQVESVIEQRPGAGGPTMATFEW